MLNLVDFNSIRQETEVINTIAHISGYFELSIPGQSLLHNVWILPIPRTSVSNNGTFVMWKSQYRSSICSRYFCCRLKRLRTYQKCHSCRILPGLRFACLAVVRIFARDKTVHHDISRIDIYFCQLLEERSTYFNAKFLLKFIACKDL